MRPIIRCPYCKLNQFHTRNGFCRRCGKDLLPPQEEKPAVRALTPTEQVKLLGACIRRYRLHFGLSQPALHRLSGMCASYLSRVERGQMHAYLASVEKIAHGLGIPIAWLFQPVTEERFAELYAHEVLAEVRMGSLGLNEVIEAVRGFISLRAKMPGRVNEAA